MNDLIHEPTATLRRAESSGDGATSAPASRACRYVRTARAAGSWRDDVRAMPLPRAAGVSRDGRSAAGVPAANAMAFVCSRAAS
ncbi:hypothetical protein KDW82_23575 [Burkholderia vietnamiensis]|uniref:hypothetical protein n=1 Tax=Burkholderia vietnamiensis TaxID=60552 RepID=UPI0012DA96D7|nr:hypothetical protein [Burkholderia vietnamiensis]MBR8192030.1 hypothetical protein [Burkholderia vietnamiensis]